MLFNSYIFWLFFACVIVLYKNLSFRAQNWMLLVASYIFYGAWDYRFLFLMMGTSIIDYFIGLRLEDARAPRARKFWLALSVIMNLGLLGFFKYFNFMAHNAHALLAFFGVQISEWTLSVILPVGISFYTFQEMSYIIDVYRGSLKASRNFIDFALFISLFPHLVAGPIQHSTWLLPQIQKPRPVSGDQFTIGLYHVLLGLFKKVVIADNVATIANVIFAKPLAQLTGPECILGVYAFAIQIYCDFSGYSSIAQGTAKWMGFDFMDNFRMPYFATSPSDFWRRWHIGLSTWLRDYLYIPLGGNRGSSLHTYRNLIVTMVLGGFWHGAAWTFVAWGAYHGLLLAIYRVFEERAPKTKKTPAPLWKKLAAMALMFHLVCVGWLFFRATSMSQVGGMLQLMATNFTPTPLAKAGFFLLAFYSVPLLLFEFWVWMKDDILALVRTDWRARGLVYNYCVLMLVFFPAETVHEFIYFQF